VTRRELLLALPAACQAQDVEFLCPMDPEVRSKGPGRCPRCGMRLEAGLPDPLEYRVELETLPGRPSAGRTTMLSFRVLDPRTGKPVVVFNEIHEKLFHLFVVSEDRTFFAHEHPERRADGSFQLPIVLPQAGMYRVLADFYPQGGTPQLIAKSLLVGAGPQITVPGPPANMAITLRPEPAQPIVGQRTMLFFDLSPAEGLEPWLGAWGHLLMASEDLLDMVHVHPKWEYQPEVAPTVQFNVIFPRPGKYRLWVQMQRKGLVNTKSFDVTARSL
jgi:hypothetical protein